MKFYKLKADNSINKVGYYPQAEMVKSLGDIQQNYIPFRGVIDFDFKLPEPYLEKRAKHNSLISVVAIPWYFLVLDDSLLNFLKDYISGNYQSWKIKTWQENQLIKKYNLLLLNETKEDRYFDFKKSNLYSKKLGDWNNSSTQKLVNVASYEEYLSVKEDLRKEKRILLHKKATIDLRGVTEDMFRMINSPSDGYFVSERLKNSIEECDFTGIRFQEINELKNVEVKY